MRVRFLRTTAHRARGAIADLDPDTADWLTARGYTQRLDDEPRPEPAKPTKRRSRRATPGVGGDPLLGETRTGSS